MPRRVTLQAARAPHHTRRAGALAGVGLAAVGVVLVLWLTGRETGSAVSVYPNARTLAASARTAITFRGVDAGELGEVTVTGSRSGPHTGRLRRHRDGRGAVFQPDRPFAPGERVTVDAGMSVAGTGEDRSSFVVARSAGIPPLRFDAAKPPADDGVQRFRSRPDLRPPAITVETATERAAPGMVFVAPKRGATQQGPMILDRAGELVWFKPLPGDEQAFDFRAQTYAGEPVLTWWQGRMATYRGAGVGRIVDAGYRPVATVRAGNGYDLDAHEVALTPAGTALVVSYTTVPWDLSKLGGRRDALLDDNVIQEIDVKTGAVLFEWHALGTIGLGESYRPAPKQRGKVHDPFHVNSIALDRDGNFIVSARHTNTIYKIDRRSGEVIWRLGGKQSTFEMRPGTTFKLQHDARPGPGNTITLFDNVAEDLPARGRSSRGVRIALDEEHHTATLVEQFKRPEGLLSPTQGSMQPLDHGGAFVGWGGLQPYFTEFDDQGGTVFDAHFAAAGVESYRAYLLPWKADPRGAPSVVADDDSAGTKLRVSWNGATGVSSWRVRTRHGEPKTAARTGFETTIALPGHPRRVRVEALDDSGAVLGRARRVVRGHDRAG
jgi:hypothetical protein